MKRFIQTRPGQAVSFVTAIALVLPFLTLATVRPAAAQLETMPVWAVVEFSDLSKKPVEGIGQMAAEAISAELAKSNRYDVLPTDTVNRTAADLGLQMPVRRPDELIRLGQNLRAQTIVSGEIVNTRIVTNGDQKRADVLVRIEVRDVASGLSVNGAALSSSSAQRSIDVDDASLFRDALSAAAFNGVKDILARTLPNATVLNTLERTALINQGARSGFERGQEVIVLRGREQVATAQVTELEPDSAVVRVVRQTKGIQPGDKVRVIFQVPTLKADFGTDASAQFVKPKSRGNANGIIQILLLLGILVFLLGQGRGSGQDLVTDVKAEADTRANDNPGVKISWRPDGFVKGNANRFAWQVWRNDVLATPVAVVPGSVTEAFDDITLRNLTWYDFGGIVGGTTCQFSDAPAVDATNINGVNAGTPYTYSVELVYKVSALDLPGEGGGGNTGGTTGTTGITAGDGYGAWGGMVAMQTTGTTGGDGSGECYFVSVRSSAIGQATPLRRPDLVSPDNDALIDPETVGGVSFQFRSVKGSVQSVAIEYLLQFSDDPLFPTNRTINVNRFIPNESLGGSTLSTEPIPASQLRAFPNSQRIYWRIGARNIADRPGPVPDAAGNRYIFSGFRFFKRPTQPPQPPE